MTIDLDVTQQELQAKARDAMEIFKKFELENVVKRVMKENPNWTQERANVAVEEYRKWLVLCSITPDLRLGMCSTDVDEIWHAHILFTREYMKLCNAIAGRYIHHQPTSDEEKASGDNSTSLLTKKVLKCVFGNVHPVWSRAVAEANCCSDCGHNKEKNEANCCSDCGHVKEKTTANCCSDCGHTKEKNDANCCSDCSKEI